MSITVFEEKYDDLRDTSFKDQNFLVMETRDDGIEVSITKIQGQRCNNLL